MSDKGLDGFGVSESGDADVYSMQHFEGVICSIREKSDDRDNVRGMARRLSKVLWNIGEDGVRARYAIRRWVMLPRR